MMICPMISDMHPEKFGYMHTPNFNAFMRDSLVLDNSHVQQAVCSPSRTSILFGRRPDTTHVYDLYDNTREVGCANCMTIPGLFSEAGYFTVGMGKIFHDGHASNNQDPQSWSDPAYAGDNFFLGTDIYAGLGSWKSVDEKATGLCQDSEVREHAVSWLRNLTNRQSSQPWFLAVGFRKPHLSFAAPQEFYDLYNVNETKLASNPFAPWDMPAIAYASFELQGQPDVKATGFTGQINETLVDWKALEEVRGYQAGVSYTDHNIGVILDELKALGHWNNTVIIFWGDHGWKLGQHGAWAKHTNFHDDTNTPVMLRVPGVTDGGVKSHALVEHVDIMATLLEAVGLAALPTCPQKEPWLTSHCTEGQSFLRLASQPAAPWKNASYSQFPRGGMMNPPYMGYSMNTDQNLRFTAWVDFNSRSNTTTFSMQGRKCGFELYNHSTDPDENYNLAYQGEYKDKVAEMFEQLKRGWRATASKMQPVRPETYVI